MKFEWTTLNEEIPKNYALNPNFGIEQNVFSLLKLPNIEAEESKEKQKYQKIQNKLFFIRHYDEKSKDGEKELDDFITDFSELQIPSEKIKIIYYDENLRKNNTEDPRVHFTANKIIDGLYIPKTNIINNEKTFDTREKKDENDILTKRKEDAVKSDEFFDYMKKFREERREKKDDNVYIFIFHKSNAEGVGRYTYVKTIADEVFTDKYSNLEGEVVDLDENGDRIFHENNYLKINHLNFIEIIEDLEFILQFEHNLKYKEKINSILEKKDNIIEFQNELNIFLDRNIDLIIENFINFEEFKNNDLKDFFINKTYNFGEELNKKDYFEGLNVKEDVLMYVEDEIKNRDFNKLGNLLKIVDTFDIEDKIRVISFIEKNKFNFNCSLLQDPLNNITHYNPQSLYENWKQKRGLGDRERITIESNIENNIKNKAKEIKLNIDSLPILNKENWDNNFVDIFNGILEQVKKFKIYYSEFTDEQKNLFEVGILGEIEINSFISESKNRSINSQDIFIGKNGLRITVRDYLNNNLHIFREFGKNLNSDLFYFCLDNNLKIDNSIPTDNQKNKGFLLELENIIKSNKELYKNKINISDIDEYSLSKENLKQFSLYKVQKLDFNKLFLLTQKGYLDLFEKDIFEHIKNDLSGKEKKKMEKIVEGVGDIVDDTGLYNFKGKTGVRGYIGEFTSDIFRAFKFMKNDIFGK